MSEVVTGDAVVLDVQIAQLPVRAVGALIDITVILAGYVFGLILWAATLTEFDSALSTAILVIFTALALLGWPLVIETATRGRSLGKIVMGLRVVSDDGGPERFRQAVFRALAALVEIWMLFGSPAVICSILSPKAKRIGDVFAGTLTVGALMAFQMLSGRVVQPLVQMVSLAQDYQETALSVRMLGEVMNRPVEPSRAPAGSGPRWISPNLFQPRSGPRARLLTSPSP